MNKIVYNKMTYNEYYTGKSLVESALSYKDGVLVVDKNKMLGEVEKAGISMGMEVGRIEGGASQKTVQDIKNKYGSSSISGNDQVPKDDNYVKYSVSDDEIPKKIINKKVDLVLDEKKYDYLFGNAAPDPHNTPRSEQLNSSLGMRGIRDDEAGRQIIREHLEQVINDPNNIIKTYQNYGKNFETRQSLLMTPSGKGLLLETSYEIMPDGSRKFVTVIPKN